MNFFKDPILNLRVTSQKVHHPHKAMGCSIVASEIEDEHCKYQLKWLQYTLGAGFERMLTVAIDLAFTQATIRFL